MAHSIQHTMLSVDPSDVVQMVPMFEESPAERVFRNELLLDHILKFAIHDGDKQIQETVNNCKLVKRQWLHRVTVVAHKKQATRTPLELNVVKEPSKFKNFFHTFKDLPAKRIPPFNLEISHSDKDAKANNCKLTKETQLDVIECLYQFGASLVNLDIDCFPAMWSLLEAPRPCHGDTKKASFPCLQHISITEYSGYDTRIVVGEKSKNLIQWILNGSKCLKAFNLDQLNSSNGDCDQEEIEIKNLHLPSTITEISLLSQDSYIQVFWEPMMLANALPNLTNLTVNGPRGEQEALHYRILERFRYQLKVLQIFERNYVKIPLPVMEKVEKLTYEESCWYNKHALGEYFPAVKEVSLASPNYNVMRKWLESGRCSSVERVVVNLNFEEIPAVNNNHMERSVIILMNLAFPNITHLSLKVPPFEDYDWIRAIFQEMQHIQKLEIDIFPYTRFDCNTGAALKAALLGLDVDEMEALDDVKENWNNLNWVHRIIEDGTSILNMNELKELRLCASGRDTESAPINLDVVLQFGLMQMPNLQKLSLRNKIKISADMVESWRSQGRSLDVRD